MELQHKNQKEDAEKTYAQNPMNNKNHNNCENDNGLKYTEITQSGIVC